MLSLKTAALAVISSTLMFVSTLSGQQAQASSRTTQDDKYVTEKGFRSRVLEVKHGDPRQLWSVLQSLGSGFKGATLSFSDELRTLTVRDFPENIAIIEEALKRLDAPQVARPDIELHIHVLFGSTTEGAPGQFPADLRDVLRQLQSTLNYKSYNLAASIVHRVKDGARGIRGSGLPEVGFLGTPGSSRPIEASYNYSIDSISLTSAPSEAPKVQLKEFRFNLRSNIFLLSNNMVDAGVNTDASVRDGEKVVVGTAALKDRALVLVLSAKVIK